MKKIAIYGKGGIGKSTLSSNISACMADMGFRIMQIGCDPKHDSTQMLCGYVDTLLDTMREKGNDLRLEDIVHKGILDICCVEIGGPQPGVGCAGRGIIRGIEFVQKQNAFEKFDIDVCIYDVLGDVVCGGFFEPIRRGEADELFIVSSGEFNSLFAANNICSGFINSISSNDNVRIGGIIGNLRGLPNERELLEEFSSHIGLPLVGIVPRSVEIERTTNNSCPLVISSPDSDLARNFRAIAKKMLEWNEEPKQLMPYSFFELKQMHNKFVNKID